jgi:tetratricopeptide (TPR) repeat protein
MPSRVITAVAGAVWLIGASTALAETPEPGAEVRQLVARAEALFELGNYQAALVDFSRAYASLEGYPRRYVVLHNIAVCYERLFRYDEALRYYERYLAEGGSDAADRQTIEAALATLSGMLATLHVASNVPAELWIDAQRHGQLPATLRLPAGKHRIEARAPLHETAQRELTVEAGEQYRLQLELEPLSTYRGPDRSLFYVTAAGTGVLLIAAGALGAQTLVARDAGVRGAADGMQLRTAALEDSQAGVKRWALATDVTLAAAALLGTTSLILYFLTDWDDEPRSAELTTARKARAW